MTQEKALEILTLHSKWRKGDDTIPMQDSFEIGEALEVAIRTLKKQTSKQTPKKS